MRWRLATQLETECPACGKLIPLVDYERHLAGLDPERPECPRQDIEAIKRMQRPRDPYPRGDNAW